jgi:splicing factor 3B subunit 3
MFASLEVDYGEKTNPHSTLMTGKMSKNVIFYELDLGLNHVVRKFCEPVPDSAHRLITVPGDIDGPGGVLVLCED